MRGRKYFNLLTMKIKLCVHNVQVSSIHLPSLETAERRQYQQYYAWNYDAARPEAEMIKMPRVCLWRLYTAVLTTY